MTIDGFWKEVKQRGNLEDLRIPFHDYVYSFHHKNGRNPTLGIDMYQWINEHASLVETESKNGFPESADAIKVVISGLLSKLNYLISLSVNFVIVFDGQLKPDKTRWKNDKCIVQNDPDIPFEEKYQQDLDILKNGSYMYHGTFITEFTKVLNALNMSYICAPGDGEIELARLNQAGVIDALISNDADGFAYGAKVILRNFSKNEKDLPSTAVGSRKTYYFVTPVDETVLKKLHLDNDKIMFMACCQGDDYTKGFKGLGIKKSWDLATKKIKDFDVVKELKNIYVPDDPSRYLLGKVAHSYQKRLQLLESLKSKLIENVNGKAYFRKAHNKEIILPSDYTFASHFFPHYAPRLFEHNAYDTCLSGYGGELEPEIRLPILPQPASILHFDEGECVIKTGNDNGGAESKKARFLNWKKFKDNVKVVHDGKKWFDSLDYAAILEWTKTSRNKKEGMEFVADRLSSTHIWRLITIIDKLDIQPTDIFIHNDKMESVKCSKEEEFEQLKYLIKFKPRRLFKSFLRLQDELYDENFNKIEEEIKQVWLPKYLLETEANGRKLIETYRNTKKASKVTPKCTPRKKNTPKQNTTLDLLSSSPKSPIKILTREPIALLEVTKASKIFSRAKRPSDKLSLNHSPKKKIKLDNNNVDREPIANSILNEPFTEDKDISEVLNSSLYIGDSVLGESDTEFHEFLKEGNCKNKAQMENISPTQQLDNWKHGSGYEYKNLSQENGLYGVKRANNSGKLSVKRGVSMFDEMTQLPSVPSEPNVSLLLVEPEDYELPNVEQNNANETCFSTDSIEILFAKEKDVIIDSNESKMCDLSDVLLNDTFSSTDSMLKIFGEKSGLVTKSDPPKDQTGSVPKLRYKTELGERNENPDTSVSSISDVETVNGDPLLTPVKEAKKEDTGTLPDPTKYPENNKILNFESKNSESSKDIFLVDETSQKEKCIDQIPEARNSCTLPSDFDDSVILLAENTEDEIMWIVPQKTK